jgi:hypothetical protein
LAFAPLFPGEFLWSGHVSLHLPYSGRTVCQLE